MITKELLVRAISSIMTTDVISYNINEKGLDVCDCIKEYSSDKILNHLNSKMEPLTTVSFLQKNSPYVDSSIVNIVNSASDMNVGRAIWLFDKPVKAACIGFSSNSASMISTDACSYTGDFCTYITEDGDVILTYEILILSYNENNSPVPVVCLRKLLGNVAFDDELIFEAFDELSEFVDDKYKNIWTV